ncbi:DUF7305 domain-containing protein [Zobellella iuensis]|uniref:DUF7305 domain-containing protein n=1 Tax=Zobellella iuensis TaxID=2803811 RepID=A0ABS1QQS1_9GAMM|nr:hypothetical protein [Zobellella iuensis]MBL1377210.1 hypothetical protein [Zobellella iuensis]
MTSFLDSAQSHHSSGTYTRSDAAKVLGDEDNRLNFNKYNNQNGYVLTCGDAPCTLSYEERSKISLPSFQKQNGGSWLSISSWNCPQSSRLSSTNFSGLEVQNCEVEVSPFKADQVTVNSGGRLVLNEGVYWFGSFSMNNNAELVINGPVTIFVKDRFGITGDAEVNPEASSRSLLMVSYNENGYSSINNNALFNGFIYSAAGVVHLTGDAEVRGRVNVYSLTMNNNTVIAGDDAVEKNDLAGSIHHYELHFNSCNALLTAKACGDASCSVLYDKKATIHVQNQDRPPRNIANFNNFVGLAQQSIAKTAQSLNYRFTLGYQANGNGGNLSPKPASGLVCYVDGQRTCTVNGKSSSGSGSGFNFAADTAYAGGEARVSMATNACSATAGQAELTLNFSTASQHSHSLAIRWPGGVATLQPGQSQLLTLPTNGVTLSYPEAELITLTVKETETGNTRQEQVAFVPKAWHVNDPKECLDDQGHFIYGEHAQSCEPLAKVGDPAPFRVSALDIKGDEITLSNWLLGKIQDNSLIEFSVKNGDITYSYSQGLKAGEQDAQPDIVGVASLRVKDWTAGYIPQGDTPLQTSGDKNTIGRTVPASLLVVEKRSGSLADGVVYAGNAVSFDEPPGFIIQGLNTKQQPLHSYRGEFAKGLLKHSRVWLDALHEYNGLELELANSAQGRHELAVINRELTFVKGEPFAETGLDVPLRFKSEDHDLTEGTTDDVSLTDAGERLRYGYLTLMDTELGINETGRMASLLHYLDLGGKVTEDRITRYSLVGVSVDYRPVLDPGLVLEAKESDVSVVPYGREVSDIRVRLEGLASWLQPYRDGELAAPEARLDIVKKLRRRANDSTFNRREVIR